MLFAAALLAAAAPAPVDVDDLFATVGGRSAPGCALDVRRNGETLARRSYGMADLESERAIAADTVFEAGSVSKQFVGALVAILATDGRLSLDDPIRRWLPELPPLYAPVTIRMLLNHTSGIRNWDNLAELTGWPEGTRVYDPDWALRAVARQRALNFTPGNEYLYGNSNYVLAARIVERAGRRTLDAFARQALFAPLGMDRTRWRADFQAVVPGRAQAYLPDGKGGWRLEMPNGNVIGPGGLLTTVGDLQRWNMALDRPSPADARWMALLARPGTLTDGTRTRYGLGLELDPIAGQPAISHAGATASYRAWLGRFPAEGLSVALLCNAGNLDTEALGPEVAARFLAPPPKAAPGEPSALDPAIVADVAGPYRNAATDAAVIAAAGRDGAIRFGNGGAAFRPAGRDRLETATGSRRATLVRDAGGRVVAIMLTRVANAPVRLVRTTAWRPDAKRLAGFAGLYRSSEIEGDQRIALRDGRLVWIDPRPTAQPLRPAYPDAFEAPDSAWTLRFHRDARGLVSGFDASITRARRIAFRRVR